jgi:hypothetical protein
LMLHDILVAQGGSTLLALFRWQARYRGRSSDLAIIHPAYVSGVSERESGEHV